MAFLARTLSEWIRSALRLKPGHCAVPESQQSLVAAPPVPTERMTERDQWQKVSGAIAASIDLVRSAKECQVEASRQLDVATYALQTLLADLAPAMALTRPVAAPVITIPSSPAPSFRRRTAIAA